MVPQRNDQDDTNVVLARIEVQLTHLEQAVRRIEAAYTTLSRFLPVEKSVFGIIAMIAVALIGIAVVKLFGSHP
jgi:hypothetical protein